MAAGVAVLAVGDDVRAEQRLVARMPDVAADAVAVPVAQPSAAPSGRVRARRDAGAGRASIRWRPAEPAGRPAATTTRPRTLVDRPYRPGARQPRFRRRRHGGPGGRRHDRVPRSGSAHSGGARTSTGLRRRRDRHVRRDHPVLPLRRRGARTTTSRRSPDRRTPPGTPYRILVEGFGDSRTIPVRRRCRASRHRPALSWLMWPWRVAPPAAIPWLRRRAASHHARLSRGDGLPR